MEKIYGMQAECDMVFSNMEELLKHQNQAGHNR